MEQLGLGEDFDAPTEYKEQRDELQQSDLNGKFIKIVSNGTNTGTHVMTSDGLDLTSYGIEAVQWTVTIEGVMATIVFRNTQIDALTPMENVYQGDMNIPTDAVDRVEYMKQHPDWVDPVTNMNYMQICNHVEQYGAGDE